MERQRASRRLGLRSRALSRALREAHRHLRPAHPRRRRALGALLLHRQRERPAQGMHPLRRRVYAPLPAPCAGPWPTSGAVFWLAAPRRLAPAPEDRKPPRQGHRRARPAARRARPVAVLSALRPFCPDPHRPAPPRPSMKPGPHQNLAPYIIGPTPTGGARPFAIKTAKNTSSAARSSTSARLKPPETRTKEPRRPKRSRPVIGSARDRQKIQSA